MLVARAGWTSFFRRSCLDLWSCPGIVDTSEPTDPSEALFH
jgi:hypothetical protein